MHHFALFISRSDEGGVDSIGMIDDLFRVFLGFLQQTRQRVVQESALGK
jgi:hypothetical protein